LRAILLLIATIILLQAKEGYLYQQPIEGVVNKDWIISNYVDKDPRKGYKRDYRGGVHTYDTHTGTDFAIKDFRHMDRGVDVYASRDGKIVRLVDGKFDRETTRNSRKSNSVYIKHSDGTYAFYAHLKKYSIKKLGLKEGQIVKEGDKIGEVGSSGDSTGAHLHFALYDQNKNVIDPADDKYHRFAFDTGYRKDVIFELGVTDDYDKNNRNWIYTPSHKDCLPHQKYEQLAIWTKYIYMDKDSNFTLKIEGPKNLSSKPYNRKKDKGIGSFWWRFVNIKLPIGEYNLKIYHNNEMVASRGFVVKDVCN
jgi:hypothetical protein